MNGIAVPNTKLDACAAAMMNCLEEKDKPDDH